MKSFLVILIGLFGSWHLIELSSDNLFSSVFAPILLFVFLISLAIWFVLKTKYGALSDDGSFLEGGNYFDSSGDDS